MNLDTWEEKSFKSLNDILEFYFKRISYNNSSRFRGKNKKESLEKFIISKRIFLARKYKSKTVGGSFIISIGRLIGTISNKGILIDT